MLLIYDLVMQLSATLKNKFAVKNIILSMLVTERKMQLKKSTKD